MIYQIRSLICSKICLFLLFLCWAGMVEAMTFNGIVKKYKDKEFYLQHNVWYRDKGKIYWFNYILAGEFLPIGSKVTVTKVKNSKIKFNVDGLEGTFSIDMWNYSGSHEKLIGMILGEKPPILDEINEVDKKGIQNGKVYEGMTRKGVFFAIGYPPLISPSRSLVGGSSDDQPVNQSLDSEKLLYWKNRFDRIIYYFDDNDIVINVRD